VVCDTSRIREGDQLICGAPDGDVGGMIVARRHDRRKYFDRRASKIMLDIFAAGGLVPYFANAEIFNSRRKILALVPQFRKQRQCVSSAIASPTAVPLACCRHWAPVVNHRGPEFRAMYARCEELMKPILGTSGRPFFSGCSGTGAMEASLANF